MMTLAILNPTRPILIQAKPKILCVEGNVGAGKTTLLDELEKDSTDFKIVREPVESFIKFGKHNPLQLQYTTPLANAAIVQLHVIQCLEQFWKSTLSGVTSKTIIISERSMYSPLLFTKALKRKGFLSDFSSDFIEEEVFKAMKRLNVPVLGADKLFYLKTPTEVCLERIRKRNRLEERRCDATYLHHVEAVANEFVSTFKCLRNPSDVMVADGTNHPLYIKEQLKRFAATIDVTGAANELTC